MAILQKISTRHIIIAVALLNLIMIFHGEVFRDLPAKHYREGSVGTHISIILLFLVGFTSLQIFLGRRDQIIWLLIGLGFVFLALDDWFMIHENIDKAIHHWFGIKQTSLTDRIDDLLIALYGLIGAFFLYRYRAEILRYDRFLRFLGIGFGILVASIVLDILSNDQAVLQWLGFSKTAALDIKLWLVAIEEVCKLMGGAVFLSGFLHVLRQVENTPPETIDLALQTTSAQSGR